MSPKAKQQIEDICKQIPGYNPWDQADDSYFNHDAAIRAINWFHDNLKHVEGSAYGEPFTLKKWQAAIIGNLFGWKRTDDKGREVRRYRRFLLYIARGNGKSPLAAGIVLYCFFEDDEQGFQGYLAACQREQAGILFRNARGMVEQNESLKSQVTMYSGDNHRSLVKIKDPMSFCKVISAEGSGQHGGIPSVALLDELHLQESRDLLTAFETGMAKKVRAQPLLGMMTTADYDRVSVCNEIYAEACLVRDNGGNKDRPGYEPSFLPVIYELPKETDIIREGKDEEEQAELEKLWQDANPNLDVSVSRESLRKIIRQAIDNPVRQNEVKRLHFNIRTAQDVRLISMPDWDACRDQSLDINDFKGKACWAGGDLASKEDLTSLSVIFPTEELGEGGIVIFSWSWCPEAKIKQRAALKRVPYDLWVKQGFLTATAGNSTSYESFRDAVVWLRDNFNLQKLSIDPYGARETATILQESHGMQEIVEEIPQTMKNLSAPTKSLIFLVKNRRIRHDGNPVLRWAASNVAGHFQGKIPDGGELQGYLDKVPVMPSKQLSSEKIDPIAATVNAIAAKESNPPGPDIEIRVF